ncbi:MAG: hypothetical protein AAF707_00430 [Pseudomonadota bacterium]
MASEPKETKYRRVIGRRVDRALNLALGAVLMSAGALFVLFSVIAAQFSLTTHWPGLAVGAVLILGSIRCFRAKGAIVEELGDEPVISAAPRQRS